MINPNLLPHHGAVYYHKDVFNAAEANSYFNSLLQNIAWKPDEVVLFGKKISTKRKTAWYGTADFSYTYANSTKIALPFTPLLLQIKNSTERACGHTFNSCLLNLYHNGSEGMGWHSDNEKEMDSVIASVSFGAARRFVFKHRVTKEKAEILLENGSLLLMKDETQQHWLHSLPPVKKPIGPRINLTFRNIILAL